jgi:SpoVK/Ycf46/Vps4 family AAA+-type ATPase
VPGTGKTEYVKYLAQKMGLEVLKKRVSDILDMYVGESEKKIAAAFCEAKEDNKFLVFDEADSFLQDRRNAVRSWEVTQVNEMLTWMEVHPLPFACTTNLSDKLDPASLRRFTFKVKFNYLNAAQVKIAFQHFLHIDYNRFIEGLTPADFVLAAKKAEILGLKNPDELVELLLTEVKAKNLSGKIGF